MWGLDVIGPIIPPTSKRHRFILAITDNFSKWAEAIPLKEVKISDVIKFIKHHVIYRFGIPQRIIHDNGPQFVSQSFQPATNSESKICLQRYTIQLPTVLQKLSTRPSENFSRSSSQKSTRPGQEIRQMSMGLPHNGEKPNKNYAFLLGVQVWSYTSIGDSNSISTYCPSHWDNEWGEAWIVPLELEALDDKCLQA